MPTFRGRTPWDEPKKKKLQLFSNGEKAGLVLCLALMLFALTSWDVPLFFFCISFLIYEVQSVLSKINARRFHFACSLLQGMCIALAFGSLCLAFF